MKQNKFINENTFFCEDEVQKIFGIVQGLISTFESQLNLKIELT